MTDCHKVWELVVNGLTYSSKSFYLKKMAMLKIFMRYDSKNV